MKVLSIVIEFLKVAFSGFATNIFGSKNKNGVVISKNTNSEITDNESNGNSVTIEKNKDTKVSRNKWK